MSANDGVLQMNRTPSLDLAWRPRARAAAPSPARPSWLAWLPRRRKPTTYERCLAIHIHFAGPHSALS